MNSDVGFELIKLLLQVITADHVISPAEHQHLQDASARLCGPRAAEAVALVDDVVAGKAKLPPPNLGVLRNHRGDVLKEVARAGAVDGVHEEELDLVAVIGELLR